MIKNKQYLSIGNDLKRLRGSLSAEYFAKRLGVSLVTYYRYERGETAISAEKMQMARVVSAENKAINDLREGDESYKLHSGYKPNAEKSLGVERGSQQWRAFEMLSKIYASADEMLINAIYSNLRAFSAAVENRSRIDHLESELAGLKAIVQEHTRASTDRRQIAGVSPTGIERRSGEDRRKPRHDGNGNPA